MSHPEPSTHGYHPTTTHAAWGTGHPRLLVSSEQDRFVYAIDCDLTRVGSADGSELFLRATDPVHAKITHGTTDEYLLEMMGQGQTSHGRETTLRTGASFTAGPWRLVFVRDEYADHGRPYGGRNGGEGAHQKRQPPRPDYEHDTAVAPATRCEIPKPSQTADVDKVKAIGRSALIDASLDPSGDGSFDFRVVRDDAAGVYVAVAGDHEVGGVTYNLIGERGIILLAVSVFPEFRGRGVATDLIRRVLDDVRASGRTISNYCPVVATFIRQNSAYADLIDQEFSGVGTPADTSGSGASAR